MNNALQRARRKRMPTRRYYDEEYDDDDDSDMDYDYDEESEEDDDW